MIHLIYKILKILHSWKYILIISFTHGILLFLAREFPTGNFNLRGTQSPRIPHREFCRDLPRPRPCPAFPLPAPWTCLINLIYRYIILAPYKISWILLLNSLVLHSFTLSLTCVWQLLRRVQVFFFASQTIGITWKSCAFLLFGFWHQQNE